jgi:hypothetical protein
MEQAIHGDGLRRISPGCWGCCWCRSPIRSSCRRRRCCCLLLLNKQLHRLSVHLPERSFLLCFL